MSVDIPEPDLTVEDQPETEESTPDPETQTAAMQPESPSENEAENKFVCEICGTSFKSRFALLGHGKRHGHEKKQALSAANEEIASLKESLTREETSRKLAEEAVKKLKASRELSAMQAAGTVDPIDRHIERILRLQEANLVGGQSSGMHVQQPQNSTDSETARRIESLESQLREERNARLQREHDEALRIAITNEVNEKISDLNQHIDRLNQKISEQPKSTDLVSNAVNNLTSVVQKSQDNISSIVKAWLTSPQPLVPGATVNPQVDELRKLGLVDSPITTKPKFEGLKTGR
jgi:hypothetical protein